MPLVTCPPIIPKKIEACIYILQNRPVHPRIRWGLVVYVPELTEASCLKVPLFPSSTCPGALFTFQLTLNFGRGLYSTQNQAFLLVEKWNSALRAFYTMSQRYTRKNLFNLPQVTNKCWTLWALYWPQGWKKDGYHWIWEANLQPLGSNNKPKMLEVGPKFFWGPDS